MKTTFTLIFSLMILSQAQANVSWNIISKKVQKLGGSAHSVSQVQCFYENKAHTEFVPTRPRDAGLQARCYNRGDLRLGNDRFFALIDYTKSSEQKRFFLVDRKTGAVESFAVAHGRYKAHYANSSPALHQNTTKYAHYFSNQLGSNAPSSGFYIAGLEYNGIFGRSLVINGLEKGINDNACERAVVIHASEYVSTTKVNIMSSGCPMVSASKIGTVLGALKGGTITRDSDWHRYRKSGLAETGGLVYIYGPREAKLSKDYCQSL